MSLYIKTNTFFITSRLILRRMRNVSDKGVEKIETHLMFNRFFKNRTSMK